jgi:sugar phosphate isomerase/epimerase
MKLGLEAGKDTLDLAVAHGVQGVPVSAGDLVNKGVDATLSPLRERGLAVCGLIHVKEVGLAEGFHLHAGLVPLGDGPTDWAHFLRLALPHLPADSWLILEHVQAADAARSLSLLRMTPTKGAD